jgi:signal transduction histidine kinase
MRSTGAPVRWPATRLTGVAWVVGALVTAAMLWTPLLAFGYRDPAVRLTVDALDTVAALLVAFLVYGHFLRHRRLQDLLLVQGLTLLGVAGIALAFVTKFLPEAEPGTLEVWLPMAVRMAASAIIVVAAFVGDLRAPHPRWRRAAVLVPAGIVVVATAALVAARPALPVALDPGYVPGSAADPILTGHPVLLFAQAFGAVCFLAASVGFTAQAMRRTDDEILRWLGPACALGGFGRVGYFLFPSVYADWLYTGDLLRTGSYVLLVVAAAREIRRFWREQTRAAVLQDRTRLARELHDGVMQELAYIRAESHSIPKEVPSRPRILAAAARALGEARAAVLALSGSRRGSLRALLEGAAGELADRLNARVDVSVDEAVRVDADQAHALVRITREAIGNAVRHGGARQVRVEVASGDARRLIIADDGTGFDIEAAKHGGGYGLTSMRDRAAGLPGTFHIESRPGEGSAVTIEW